MSKPITAERETMGARWRVSFHGPHGQIEKLEEGVWVRVHFGLRDDVTELANCIDDAYAKTAEKERARVG